MLKRLVRLAQPVFLVLALLFIALLLRSQWDELRTYEWQIHGGWLAVSGILLVASWFVEVSIWRTVLGWVGGYIGYAAAVRIWFASILVRYIPGNIWQPLGMTVLARQVGVRPAATVASIALFQAVNLLSVVPFLAGYLLSGGVIGGTAVAQITPWLASIVAVPVVVFLVQPNWLISLLNFTLVRLRREPLAAQIGSGQLLAILLVSVGNWLLWGASFAALTLSLHDFDPAQLAHVVPMLLIVYPIAYAIGYLSFLTPGGLAVREGTLVLLLMSTIGTVATVAALSMRLWQVILEVIVAGVVALITRRQHLPLRSTHPSRSDNRL